LTLTEPETRYTLVISQDSIMYYHDGYKKDKIIYQKYNIFIFDEGHVWINGSYAYVEFFGEHYTKYKITNEKHE